LNPVHYFVVPRVHRHDGGDFFADGLFDSRRAGQRLSLGVLQNLPLLPGDYFRQLAQALSWLDFALLALKTCLFGFIIAIVTCYHGLAQPLRLEEVSYATVRAVAQSVIACVALDAVFIVIYLNRLMSAAPSIQLFAGGGMRGVAVTSTRGLDAVAVEEVNWTVAAGEFW